MGLPPPPFSLVKTFWMSKPPPPTFKIDATCLKDLLGVNIIDVDYSKLSVDDIFCAFTGFMEP